MKTYHIRYMPVSSPSVTNPKNWGSVDIQVRATTPAEARQQIPELYQKYMVQMTELET